MASKLITMTRLVWFDTDLLTHQEAPTRESVYLGILMKCGWRNGTLMAEIPKLSAIKRMASERIPDGLSSKRLDFMLQRINTGQLSLRLPGLEGESHEARAASTPLVEFLLTRDQKKIGANPRFHDVDDYFLDTPTMKTMNQWDDLSFQRSLDLLVIGSNRIDLVDQYLPLDRRNPVLKHLADVFGSRGEFRHHLVGRPKLWLHCAERSPGLIGPSETTHTLLERMKLSSLSEAFEVIFAIWNMKEHHSRYLLGDIGGLMLGESLNMPGPVSVTSVQDHLDLRASLDERIKQGKGLVKILKIQ